MAASFVVGANKQMSEWYLYVYFLHSLLKRETEGKMDDGMFLFNIA